MKFENNLKKLEETVSKMEHGELDIDGMIAAYEEGRRLSEECLKELDAIRLRIDKVTADGKTEEINP